MYSGRVTKRGPVLQTRMQHSRWCGILPVKLEGVYRDVACEIVLYATDDPALYLVALSDGPHHHHIGSVRRLGGDGSWTAYGGVGLAEVGHDPLWPSRLEAVKALARDYLQRLAVATRELEERQRRRLRGAA